MKQIIPDEYDAYSSYDPDPSIPEEDPDLFFSEHSSSKNASFENILHRFPKPGHRTVPAFLISCMVLLIAGTVIYSCLLPIYRDGTAAEKKILAEHTALSEEMQKKFNEIHLYLTEIKDTPAQGTSADIDSGSFTNKSAAELSDIREQLVSFEKDISAYRDSHNIDDPAIRRELEKLSSDLNTASSNLHEIKAETNEHFIAFQKNDETKNRELHEYLDAANENKKRLRSDLNEVQNKIEKLLQELQVKTASDHTDLIQLLEAQKEDLAAQQKKIASDVRREVAAEVSGQLGEDLEKRITSLHCSIQHLQEAQDSLSSRIEQQTDFSAGQRAAADQIQQQLLSLTDLIQRESDGISEEMIKNERLKLITALQSIGAEISEEADWEDICALIRSLRPFSSDTAAENSAAG